MEIEKKHKEHYSPLTYFVAYLFIVVVTVANWALSRGDQTPLRLPVAFALAGVSVLTVLLVFMHLALHHGASKMVLFVAGSLIAVLIVFVMLEEITRYGPTQPGGVPDSELTPHRPAPTRTVPNDVGQPPTHRLPGF